METDIGRSKYCNYRLFTLFDQSLQFSFGQKICKCRGYLEFLIEDKIW